MYLFLEIERSARTPSELERRLETYLIHSLLRPSERAQVAALWVFDSLIDELGAWILLRKWCQKTGRKSFIATSNVELIQEQGALGRVWKIQDSELGPDSTLFETFDNLDPPLDWRGN